MNITYNIYNMNVVYIYLHTSINMNIYIYTYYKYAVWRYRCWTCLVAPWSPWPLGTSKSIKSTWYLQNDAQICPNSRPMDTYGIFMHQHVLSMCSACAEQCLRSLNIFQVYLSVSTPAKWTVQICCTRTCLAIGSLSLRAWSIGWYEEIDQSSCY